MTTFRNPNPYADIDWNHTIQITGCTHMHCLNAQTLQKYLNEGLNFATISNYYPSAPYYPIRSIQQNTFRCRQTGCICNNQWSQNTFDWNKIILQWSQELSEETRKKLPFQEGEPLFPNVPDQLLEAPNAEYHWFSDASIYLHITAPGSTLTSSHFDNRHEFKLAEHGYALGTPLPWRQAFQKILDSLITPDGGGIVIAHPTWSHHPLDHLEELLDFDSRVLGIEVFNNNSRMDFADFSDTVWDAILSTGRQCFGFFVQDHPDLSLPWRGRIILLPEERTAASCLKAMRDGRFYGAIAGNGLHFDYLNFDGRSLRARCNREVEFQLLSRTGVVGDVSHGKEYLFNLPENQREKHVFIRLTAREGRENEKLYSQPFMLI